MDFAKAPALRELRPLSAPAMDHGARGFRVNFAEIEKAQEIPTLDTRAFAAGAAGAAAIGEGLQQFGGALEKLAAKQAEAVSLRKVAKAEAMMIEARADIDARVALESDELKWTGIAEAAAADWEKKWLGGTLSPDARDEIERRSILWRARTLGEVKVSSARASFDKANHVLEDRRRANIVEGNIDGAKAQTHSKVRLGFITPEAGVVEDADTEAGVLAHTKRQAVLEAEADAAAMPWQWRDRHQEPGEMDPDAWRAGTAMARQVIGAQTEMATDDISDAMATGELKTEQDVIDRADGRLSPAALEAAKAEFRRWRDAAAKAETQSESAVMRNFGALREAVDAYDRKEDADGAAYAALVWQIRALMPEELRGELTQPLSKKWNPPVMPEAPEPVKSFVRDMLSEWYASGRFGPLTKEVALDSTDPDYEEGKTKTVPDNDGRDKARLARGKAELAMHSWLRDNPGAPLDDAKKALLKAAGASLQPRDVDAMLKRPAEPPPPPPPPPERMEELRSRYKQQVDGLDLPAGAGGASNAPSLLPDFTPAPLPPK